jgi:DNA polymerase-3 subunit delta'
VKGAAGLQAEAIAAAAAGRIGWALRALADPGMLDERSQLLDDALRVAHGGRVERFGWAKEAERRAPDVRERYLRALDVWEDWWRDVLLAGQDGHEGLSNRDREPVLRQEGKLYTAGDIVRFLRALVQTREYLQQNVDPQLALENLTLDVPRPSVARSG